MRVLNNRNKSLAVLLALILPVGCLAGVVSSPDSAVHLSLSFLTEAGGQITKIQQSNSTALVSIETDSTTPFLKKLFPSKAAWRVQYTDFSWDVSEKQNSVNHAIPELFVYVDSMTGLPAKIVLKIADIIPSVDREIPAADAEKQIEDLGEQYIGLPDSPPEKGLLEVFKMHGLDVQAARMIEVQYVLYTRSRTDKDTGTQERTTPRPVWVVTFRGMKPSEGIGGSIEHIPPYARNRMRCIFDANTGAMLSCGSTPSVAVAPEDRIQPKDR